MAEFGCSALHFDGPFMINQLGPSTECAQSIQSQFAIEAVDHCGWLFCDSYMLNEPQRSEKQLYDPCYFNLSIRPQCITTNSLTWRLISWQHIRHPINSHAKPLSTKMECVRNIFHIDKSDDQPNWNLIPFETVDFASFPIILCHPLCV